MPTIGLRKSIFIGLEMARMKISRGGMSFASLERNAGFPVSLRRAAALRSRRMGAYVSRPTTRRSSPNAPPKMARIQNTQVQDLFSTRKPPHTGPMTGPSKGPILQIAIAPARCSGGNISAIVPPPSVRGADPAQPARRRKAMSMPIEFESAQATLKITKRTLQMLYRRLRP